MPTDHIAHALVVTALFRYCFQGFRYNKSDIVRHEGKRIHSTDIYAAIPSVPIIHDMSDLVGYFGSRIRHSRRHQTGIVRLYLVIQIVCMRIIQPMPGSGRHDSLQNIITGRLVRMPERIAGCCKSHCKRIDRSIQPQAVEDIDKRQVHINIVIQPGRVLIPPLDIPIRPGNRDILLDHRPVIPELCRSAIGTTDRLSGPTAFYLIQ